MIYIFSALLALAIAQGFSRIARRRRALAYGIAAAACVLLLFSTVLNTQGPAIDILADLIGSGLLPFVLFAIVMFAGCFDTGTKTKSRLMKIHEPLYITAAVFTCGHIAYSIASHAIRLGSDTLFPWSSAILIIILIILAATSTRPARKLLRAKRWKKTHRLAYMFFFVSCIHSIYACVLLENMAPSMLYATTGILYVALKSTACTRPTGSAR